MIQSIQHEHRSTEQECEHEKKLEQHHAPKLSIGGAWQGDFSGGHSAKIVILPIRETGIRERS
jgi:hypothetical protein